MSNKALSYMLATTVALSVVAIKPASAQNLWQNLQQQATPFFKSAVGKVKQNIQGKMNGSGSGQGSMPPAGYGNGYQPANDRGANGVPGSGYQGGGYQSQGNGYQGQGNGYQNQGNGYGDPSQGYANQGNTYQPDYQPNSGGPPQGNGYQSPGGYQQQGSGYQPQGNGYQSQGGYQPQSGGYQPQNSDYPIGGNQPQGNEYMRGDGNGGYGAPPSPSGFNAPSSAPTPNPDYKPVHLGGGRMNSRQMFKQPSN